MRRNVVVEAVCAVALFAVWTPTLQAQEWSLREAPTVRVVERVDGQERVVITGQLLSLWPDSVRYHRRWGNAAGTQTLALLPHYRVERLANSSSPSRAGRGALIGLGVGVLIGFAAPCESDGFVSCDNTRALGAGLLGLVGLGVGAIVGWNSREEIWEPMTYQEAVP